MKPVDSANIRTIFLPLLTNGKNQFPPAKNEMDGDFRRFLQQPIEKIPCFRCKQRIDLAVPPGGGEANDLQAAPVHYKVNKAADL
jgi:hypothetical protein